MAVVARLPESGESPFQPWRVDLFGGIALTSPLGCRPVLPKRSQRLVAYLALSGATPRIVAAEALWPETSERQALTNLRTTAHQVRMACPGLLADSVNPLDLGPDVVVDVRRFRSIADAPEESLDEQPALLRLLLSSGDLLPGWYDDWVIFEQERLRRQRQIRLEEEAKRLLMAGASTQALALAQRAADLDPLRESAQRALIEVHLDMGNRIDALRTYSAFRTHSMREFGVGPSTHLEGLIKPLLSERAAVKTAGAARR